MTLRAVTLLPEPTCLSPDTSLLDALRRMLDKGVNHLPVCDGGVWAGLVDINDILYELLPVSARVDHGLKDLRFVGDGIPLLASHFKDLANKPVREVVHHDCPSWMKTPRCWKPPCCCTGMSRPCRCWMPMENSRACCRAAPC